MQMQLCNAITIQKEVNHGRFESGTTFGLLISVEQFSYRVFSRDVTAAMLVYTTNPPGIELYYHANDFSCFGGKTRFLIS